MNGSIAGQAREDWERARRRALWAAVVDTLTQRETQLLPLDEVKKRLQIQGSHYRGLQQVPLHQIIGSEGRYADFDRSFLPRSGTTAQRWMSVSNAQYQDIPLPPVELYKIGDVYFVKDGNHRVSVARQRGQYDIDAYVTEYEVDVPLDETVSPRDLLLKEEYSDFLRQTNLARLRPQQRVELSELGGYRQLIEHISTHRYYLGIERNAPVAPSDAVESWYDNVYRPVVEAIHKHDILRAFPGRTEADLYLWIMQHRAVLLEDIGVDPGPEVATLDYVQRFHPRSLLGTLGEALQAIAHAAGTLTEPEDTGYPAADAPSERAEADKLCTQVECELTNPADVARLQKHIEDHQAFLSAQWQRPVDREEAVRDWHANYYQPTAEAIHDQHLLSDWPGRTEADLYLAVMDQIEALKGAARAARLCERAAALHEHLWTAGTAQVNRFLGYLHQRLSPSSGDHLTAQPVAPEAPRDVSDA
jgi:hypothetical protein